MAKQEVLDAFDLELWPGRIAVVEKAGEMTEGGLYVPEEVRKGSMQTNEGEIVGIGEDVDFCTIGDHVYYTKHSGFYAKRNGVEFRIMNDNDIIGRVLTEVANG